jgi:acetoin utilization deacetylase AcuC-like enzyme
MPSVFLEHPSSFEHDTGGHPEQAARIAAIQRELDEREWLGFERVRSPAVDRDVLTAVHPVSYVDSIEALSARGGGAIDMDTIASAGSFNAALHAAGGAVRMVELLLDAEAERGFSAHRPPGHHATRSRAMGFCLFNSVAVAAAMAIEDYELQRVLVLDWDVHHGNGTAESFRTRSDVLYASLHQGNFYPGTGPLSDAGSGAGEGFTINLPVPAGSGEELWLSLLARVVIPAARAFAPQLVLISAGFDAHRADPLGECRLETRSFGEMARHVRDLARECQAPVGVVLEGGYEPRALAESLRETLLALVDDRPPRSLAGEDALTARAVAYLGRYWSL